MLLANAGDSSLLILRSFFYSKLGKRCFLPCIVWFGCILWDINPRVLFNAKSCPHTGTQTYTYIHIYDLSENNP